MASQWAGGRLKRCQDCGAVVDRPWGDHPCQAHRMEPPLPDATPFSVFQERTAAELAEILRRLSRALTPPPRDEAEYERLWQISLQTPPQVQEIIDRYRRMEAQ